MVRSSREISLIDSYYRESSTIMYYDFRDFRKYYCIKYKRNTNLTNWASDESNAIETIKATLSVASKNVME